MRALLVVSLAGLLLCASANIVCASQLREAILGGNVTLDDTATNYRLKVTYKPDASGSYPKSSTSIAPIVLTIGIRDIIFPRKAFQYFHDASSPTPLFTSYPDNNHGRFYMSGGDGEKSYRIGFVFDKYRLLSRELYKHMETQPEVVHFDRKSRW